MQVVVLTIGLVLAMLVIIRELFVTHQMNKQLKDLIDKSIIDLDTALKRAHERTEHDRNEYEKAIRPRDHSPDNPDNYGK